MLSAAFDAALRARCAAHLARFERRAVAPDGRRHAAVAAVILPGEDGRACFLLTKRMPKLRAHGGQWALPGGRVDPGEAVEAAALRELQEYPHLDAYQPAPDRPPVQDTCAGTRMLHNRPLKGRTAPPWTHPAYP